MTAMMRTAIGFKLSTSMNGERTDSCAHAREALFQLSKSEHPNCITAVAMQQVEKPIDWVQRLWYT